MFLDASLKRSVITGVNYLAAKLTRHQKNNHMTELNLFLRFIAPANAGCSAYSKASSTPEFLNPMETILFAAFLSLSCVVLQFSQVHSLTANVSVSFLIPQVLQIFELGFKSSNISYFFTLPFRFIFKHSFKHIPPTIAYRSSKFMVFNHSFNIQIFYYHKVKTIGYLVCRFM